MLTVCDSPRSPRQSLANPGFNGGIIQSQTLQQAPPVAQAAPQFQAVDQQATQQVLQAQQLQAQINAQGQQGPMPAEPGHAEHRFA